MIHTYGNGYCVFVLQMWMSVPMPRGVTNLVSTTLAASSVSVAHRRFSTLQTIGLVGVSPTVRLGHRSSIFSSQSYKSEDFHGGNFSESTREPCKMNRRWPNVRTIVPTLGQPALLSGFCWTVGRQGCRRDCVYSINPSSIHMVMFCDQPYIVIVISPGPRLNIKTVLSMYGDFHVKDKTAVRTSYL